MTKDEALRLALDALEKISMGGDPRWADEAITAINETLETEEGLLDRKSYLLGLYDQKSRVGIETKDEPVAWGMEKDGVILDVISPDEHDREEGGYTVPLYKIPQPKLETKDEPVAWMYWQSCLNDDGTQTSPWVQRYSKFKPTESVINKDITPLYTTPQSETKDELICDKNPQGCWSVRCQLGNKCKNTTPQRTWVGLTEDEIHECFEECCNLKVVDPKGGVRGSVNIFDVGRAIEAKLKDRNT